jgi:hypothetical protein
MEAMKRQMRMVKGGRDEDERVNEDSDDEDEDPQDWEKIGFCEFKASNR